MNNYKIKVNDEDENKEVISLFVQLGCVDSKSNRFGLVYTIGKKIGCDRLTHWDYYTTQGCQELTLHQLRDLVVLHRNDVKDATHTDQDGTSWTCVDFEKRTGLWWSGNQWRQSEFSFDLDLNPIIQNPEQGLISWADALRALADGKEVEYRAKEENEHIWYSPKELTIESISSGSYLFRLKPSTIKLELEIPAPFEPNVGEEYFYLAHTNTGYDSDIYESKNIDECQTQFGAWRTKEEIKQVVAAWRGGIKG